MKKSLFTMLAVCLSFGAFAQGSSVSNSLSAPKSKIADQESISSNLGPVNYSSSRYTKPMNPPNAKSAAITVIPVGNAANTFTAIGARTQVYANQALNTITFIHRATTATQTPAGPGSGYYWYDISKDGGTTWTVNNGPIYDPTDTVPALFANGRYPQGIIENPAGNTNPDNAFITWHAPTLTGGNGASWGGYAFGAAKLDGSSIYQNQETSVNASGIYYQVPDDMCHGVPGETWTTEPSINLNLATPDYIDSIMVRRGLWNTTPAPHHAYTDIAVEWPVSVDGDGNKQIANTSVAFGPGGQTGYISALCHIDYTFEPDSVLYIVTIKTTDGGVTWGSPIQVDVSSIADPLLASDPNGSYTTGFELKTAVDINGNLHVACAVGPDADGFSIGTEPGDWGILNIYTTDGGTTWAGILCATPQQFRGTWDPGNFDLTEDSRPYITTSVDHSKMFISWLDTDSTIWSTLEGNSHPDLWVMGFDPTVGMATAATDFTVGTSADGIVTYGVASKRTFEPAAGTYEIPYVYMHNEPQWSSTDMKEFYYISGATFVDADFNNPVGINEIENEYGTLTNVYPNPMSEFTQVSLTLEQRVNVEMVITNTLGQVVRSENMGNMNPGTHTITVEKGTLESGMYLLTMRLNDSTLTQRLMVK